MSFDTAPLRDKSRFNKKIRDYFDSRNYLEVESPLLSASPIPESHIELFRTNRRLPEGKSSALYLLPSPEMWMKMLLADGAPSLYQIGRCFRNGEQLDKWHRLEFTMLEWYTLEATAEDNIDEIQNLLKVCSEVIGAEKNDSLSGIVRRITMEEAFQDFAGFSLEDDLRDAGLADIHVSDEEYTAVSTEIATVLACRLTERNMPYEKDENADDLFHRLFLTLVEDSLPTDRPLALTHWPQLVPTLAKRIPGSPWSERWELYIQGVEVANCYGEESDASVLEKYWSSETQLKIAAESGFRIPENYGKEWIEHVSRGLPECSGVAVGLDRLLALMRGDDGLEGLDLFPIRDIIRR